MLTTVSTVGTDVGIAFVLNPASSLATVVLGVVVTISVPVPRPAVDGAAVIPALTELFEIEFAVELGRAVTTPPFVPVTVLVVRDTAGVMPRSASVEDLAALVALATVLLLAAVVSLRSGSVITLVVTGVTTLNCALVVSAGAVLLPVSGVVGVLATVVPVSGVVTMASVSSIVEVRASSVAAVVSIPDVMVLLPKSGVVALVPASAVGAREIVPGVLEIVATLRVRAVVSISGVMVVVPEVAVVALVPASRVRALVLLISGVIVVVGAAVVASSSAAESAPVSGAVAVMSTVGVAVLVSEPGAVEFEFVVSEALAVAGRRVVDTSGDSWNFVT